MKRFETERTFMRPVGTEDTFDFYTLNLDPEVMQYTGDRSFNSMEDARSFLEQYDQFTKYGIGRFAVIEKSSNRFIGWCGLKYHSKTDEYDLGFRFLKTYWNKGFATETSRKWLEYSFTEMQLSAVIGRSMSANIASIRVLEKIGMELKQKRTCGGEDGVIYEITKNKYEAWAS